MVMVHIVVVLVMRVWSSRWVATIWKKYCPHHQGKSLYWWWRQCVHPRTLVLTYVNVWCHNPDNLNMKLFMQNFILVHIIYTVSEDKIKIGVHVTICKE